MGHRKKHAPHRGSLGFIRKRARRHTARWRNWGVSDEPKLMGFAGYKVGMTHVAMINANNFSPSYKQEQITPVTVIETPPITVFGIRLYGNDPEKPGIIVLKQIWSPKTEKDLLKRIKVPKKKINLDEEISEARNFLDKTVEIRVLAHTNPRQAGLPQKKPDILEIKVGGKVTEAFDYAKSILGTSLEMKDVFKPGEHIDVTATTKGKGFAGPVKRHHIKILPRKTRKGRRVVACIGPWHPARVMWTVPRAGQLGYFVRTEFNKMILKISDDGEEINPSSGFKRYGVVKTHCLVQGSVPGSVKRLVRFRSPIRPTKRDFDKIDLTYISKKPKN